MRKHIYFAAAILASLASCADDVFESPSMPGVEGQTEMLSQDFTLGVALNLNDPTTRADFAGATGSTNPFQNVYFEPEFSSSALNLTDVSTVRGDQVGLCLVNGSNAVTNIPFFIAGYESNARLQNSDAPKQIYPLKADDTAGSLYYLGAANGGSTNATKIDYTSGYLALGGSQAWYGTNEETSFNTLVGYVTNGTIKTTYTDCPDVTKGLFKAPFPVMTGKYFAYFPFDKNFLTQGKIPVTELTQFTNQTAYGNKDNVKIFAYSSKIQNFDNSKVSGQFVLDKNLAMIMQINLQNYDATAAPANVTPNLVTMTVEDAEGNPQEAFVLNGTIGFEGENAKFVPGDKKSNIMGVSLNGTTGVAIAGATTASDNIVYLPIYPVGGVEGTIVIRIYTATADGQQVYTYKLNNVTGSALTAGSNLAPRITINLADLTPEVATPLVYNAETFESALSKGSSTEATTIQLLGNIDYDRAFPAGIADKSYVVKGGSVKFSNASSLTSNAPKNMTFECPVELASPLTISEGNTWIFNDGLTISHASGLKVNGKVSADNINVKTLLQLGNDAATANLTAETITNNGKFYAKRGVLTVTEAIDNNGTLNVGETAALTLKVAAINNAKGKTLTWYNSEMATGLTITNEGTLAIANANGINFNGATLTNNGDVVLDATSAATRLNVNTGTITNNGNIEVTSVSGNAATLAIINGVSFTNNSRIIDNGQVYGQNFVTNGVDAEFIRVVSSAADFQAANLIKAYTTIQVGGAITSGLTDLNVTKNLILNANLTMTGSCKNISVENDAILTSSALEVDGNITIAAGKTLTIGDNSFINVSGNIETLEYEGSYGDFKFNSTAPETRPSVIANDIVTNGANWTSYPVYGNN